MSIDEMSNDQLIGYIAALLCDRIFMYWPFHICLYFTCCLFVKYYVHILKLNDIMQKEQHNKELEWDILLEKYKALTESFSKEFHPYLKMTLELYIFLTALGVFINLFDYPTKHKWLSIWCYIGDVFDSLLYPIFAALITDAFQDFEKLLWKHCMDHIKEESYYKNLLLNYTMRYPFVVKAGNLRISRNNVVKFLIVFAVTKIISYLLRAVLSY